MTSPEQVISEQQTAIASTTGNEISTYAEIFAGTMSQLNAVALQQTESLLNIAVTAAEKFHSLNSSAEINKDELAQFTNQIKSATDKISQINQPETETAAAAPTSESFPAIVAQALNLAFQNSVSNQQALNQMGESILGKAALLLLSSGEKQN
jgi:vacuolar-type H+-ATPase subunit I/STV1